MAITLRLLRQHCHTTMGCMITIYKMQGVAEMGLESDQPLLLTLLLTLLPLMWMERKLEGKCWKLLHSPSWIPSKRYVYSLIKKSAHVDFWS
mmetsp:Transcript_24537/g.48848  ORF Transcript_24537/g.48848 Transcript_24537/m.48848 type:complete len:92 (-) Transcript_24537:56-331(-)